MKQEEDFMSGLTEPSVYMTQLDDLKSKLPPMVDDFEKYYVFYHKNPEYTEYQNMFDNIETNLKKVHTQQTDITNEIRNGTNFINSRFKELDKQIEREKQQNKMLRKKLGMVEAKYDGSHEMIEDYKEVYNMYYMKNFGVLVGILMLSLAAKKLFPSK